MRKRIADWGLADQVEVQSAGTWARDGDRASDGAATALGQRGISLEAHRSQTMTSQLLEAANIVLVMEEEHRRSLFYLEPKHLRKVFLLTEMVGRSAEIADPYGGPPEGYAETADELDRLIGAGLPAILRRIGVARPQQP
ncbi:MAG: protein arginine phosphatase [Chloroflexota bacterium]|nr:protein arginine phosphatase [Chloroflexota bacterium]